MTTYLHPSLTTLPLPSRGTGTLALSPLAPGTRLIADAPVLGATTRQQLNHSVLAPALLATYTSLPTATRARVRDLAADAAALDRWREIFMKEEDAVRGWGDRPAADTSGLGVEEKARVMAAWGVNCFAVPGGEGEWTAVVAPGAARVNHSCVPNAAWAWNGAVGRITVQAIREVGAGEEVTVAYVDTVLGGEERRRRLREGYGFECGCEACVGEGEEEGVLDGWRARIGEIGRGLREGGGSAEEVRALVEEGVELHGRCGLVGVHLANL